MSIPDRLPWAGRGVVDRRLVLVVLLWGCEPAQPVAWIQAECVQPDTELHVEFLLRSQRATGAFVRDPSSASINPYFANLAARALLVRPGNEQAVRRWLEWYLRHLSADGTVDDHVVRAGVEQPKGSYDSADSYAATFLIAVSEYLEATGDLAFVREHQAHLLRVVSLLEQLTAADHLTWAKSGYPFKLLMDNVEVWAAWRAWEKVQRLWGDFDSAAQAQLKAAATAKALGLFEVGTDSAAWAINGNGQRLLVDSNRFYPDAVSQLFPLAYGMNVAPEAYRRFVALRPEWDELQSDHFPWMLVAKAAAQAGDTERLQSVARATRERFPSQQAPWFIAESAWLLESFERPICNTLRAEGSPRFEPR